MLINHYDWSNKICWNLLEVRLMGSDILGSHDQVNTSAPVIFKVKDECNIGQQNIYNITKCIPNHPDYLN